MTVLRQGDGLPPAGTDRVWVLDPENENEEGVPVREFELLRNGYWHPDNGDEDAVPFGHLANSYGEVYTDEDEAQDAANGRAREPRMDGVRELHRGTTRIVFTDAELAEHDARIRASAEAAVRESLQRDALVHVPDPDMLADSVRAVRDRLAELDSIETTSPAPLLRDPVTKREFLTMVTAVTEAWAEHRGAGRTEPHPDLASALYRLDGAVHVLWGAR